MLANFGLHRDAPGRAADGWPNPAAGPAASRRRRGAGTGEGFFRPWPRAVADCAHVYATTVRKRG